MILRYGGGLKLHIVVLFLGLMKFINFTEANFSQPVISISGDDVIVKVEVEDLNFRTFTWFVDTGTLEVDLANVSVDSINVVQTELLQNPFIGQFFVSNVPSILTNQNDSFNSTLTFSLDEVVCDIFSFGVDGAGRVEQIVDCDLFPLRIDCDITPRIWLSLRDVADLGVSGLDEIAISQQRPLDPTSLGPPCVSSIDSRMFHLNLSECEPFIECDGDLLTFTWTIRNHPFVSFDSPIQRFDEKCFNVTCVYDKTALVKSTQFNATIFKTELSPVSEEGVFDIDLLLYHDENRTSLIEPTDAIIVPDYIYASVQLSNGLRGTNSLFVKVLECDVADSPILADVTVDYPLILDGCADPAHEPNEAIVVTRNDELFKSHFQFRSFVWTDLDAPLFVCCSVSICDNDAINTECGTLDCGAGEPLQRRSTDEEHFLTFGPLRVTKSKLDCSENNGGCSDICLTIDDNVICSCPEGKVLSPNFKTCIESENFPNSDVPIVEEDNQEFFIASLLLLIVPLVFLGMFIFFCRWLNV